MKKYRIIWGWKDARTYQVHNSEEWSDTFSSKKSALEDIIKEVDRYFQKDSKIYKELYFQIEEI